MVALVALVAGCGPTTADGSISSPVPLPEGLCAAVPAEEVERWSLEEVASDLTTGRDRTTSSCEMEGTNSGPVDLTVELTAHGGTAAADSKEAAEDAIRAACEELQTDSDGVFESRPSGCEWIDTDDPARSTTYVVVSSAPLMDAVNRVEMSTTGRGWQIVPVSAVGIDGAISLGDATDLTPAVGSPPPTGGPSR